MTPSPSVFGQELRRWRTTRRMSQLELASAAEVSQRHLSFLENGRSKPSPEMVVHLGRMLDLPLRDQNLLLTAAGFAPAFAQRSLDDPELDQVRRVLSTLLDAHGHYPAYVIDRGWDLVLANPIAAVVMGSVDPPPEIAGNVLKLALHPDGLQPLIRNWRSFSISLLHRLQRELEHSPHDDHVRRLLDEVMTYPGIDDLPERPSLPTGKDLLVSMEVELHGVELRFFTTITTIGAAFDITLEELRMETLLPADEATERFLQDAARGGST